MRAEAVLTVMAGSLLLACQVLRGAESADVGGELSQQSRAAVLVREALKAESQGDAEQRRALLRAALDEDADYAPARWHLGYVKVGDRWLSAEEVTLERQVWNYYVGGTTATMNRIGPTRSRRSRRATCCSRAGAAHWSWMCKGTEGTGFVFIRRVPLSSVS